MPPRDSSSIASRRRGATRCPSSSTPTTAPAGRSTARSSVPADARPRDSCRPTRTGSARASPRRASRTSTATASRRPSSTARRSDWSSSRTSRCAPRACARTTTGPTSSTPSTATGSPCSRCCRRTRPRPRAAELQRRRRARAPRRDPRLLRGRRARRSKTSGTASGPPRTTSALPIHFHLSGGHAQHRVRRSWQRPVAVAVSADAARRGARRHVVLRHLRTPPERAARARRVRPRMAARTSSTGSTTSSTSTATRVEGRLEAEPSEYFRRHVFLTYEEDNIGLAYLDRIGADNVMWASDYPHGDSTWPNSRDAIATSRLGTARRRHAPQDRLRQRRDALRLPDLTNPVLASVAALLPWMSDAKTVSLRW